MNTVVLEPADCAALWQAARLDDLRIACRGRDEELYNTLHAIYTGNLSWLDSVSRKVQKQQAETRQPLKWVTPNDLAKQIGVTPRTIRNDITREHLRASKSGSVWLIQLDDALAYLAGRQKT